jgi:hypothetical protein
MLKLNKKRSNKGRKWRGKTWMTAREEMEGKNMDDR